jgi:hypothetical protein
VTPDEIDRLYGAVMLAAEEETVSASEAIARLRELRAKATAGPWCAPDASEGDVWAVAINGDPFIPLMRSERGNYKSWGKSLTNDERNANAAAIVAAMNSLPALLECAEALADLSSWFTTPQVGGQVWMIPAGERGADDAVKQARLALQALAEGGGE